MLKAVTQRLHRTAGLPAAVIAAAVLASPAPATAAAPVGATATAAARSPAKAPAALPTVQPKTGPAFVPVLGDWEGTARGFAASFQLTYDPALRRRRGVSRYGISHVVVLSPNACPVRASADGAEMIGGPTPGAIGGFGSLGLTPFGLAGALTGARTATLSQAIALPACRGTLTWHMHPEQRRPVQDGRWTAHFAHGQTESFTVAAGGRLAVSLRLPPLLTACNGLSGAINLFIGPGGLAAYAGASVDARVSFAGASAIGTLDAPGAGCPGGPIRFTASAVS